MNARLQGHSAHFKDYVELHDVILHMADELWRGEVSC